MPINKESTPPPLIGKIGPYTVFFTPPATPKPSESVAASPKKPLHSPPMQRVQPRAAAAAPAPPVQPPPQQFHKPTAVRSPSDSSVFGFFWDAVAKVQDAHSSLDDFVARWFGLNQSKYQWALDDYYESKETFKIFAQDLKQKKGLAATFQRELVACNSCNKIQAGGEIAPFEREIQVDITTIFRTEIQSSNCKKVIQVH